MGSDYRYARQHYQDVSADGVVTALQDLSSAPRVVIATPTDPKDTVFIQKIEFAVTTDNAATQQFRSLTTDVPIAGTKASPGIGPITFDFGDRGKALPEGEGLELVNSGAGLAYSYVVQAYRRRTGAGVP